MIYPKGMEVRIVGGMKDGNVALITSKKRMSGSMPYYSVKIVPSGLCWEVYERNLIPTDLSKDPNAAFRVKKHEVI